MIKILNDFARLALIAFSINFMVIFLNNAIACDWVEYSGIASVRDGDGVDISGMSVDLFGLDAPPRTTPAGIQSMEYLRFLIDGLAVTAFCVDVHSSSKPRCRIIHEGLDVNIKLLDKGFASVIYPTMPAYQASERHAREYLSN